jgi:hypothetical protein
MVLYLRKVVHQQARESYRVVLKDDASETEVGSIGPQHEAGAVTRWVWAIDTVVPMREHEQTGYGTDLKDCQRQFKAAGDQIPRA